MGRVVCVGLATFDVIQYADRLPDPGTKATATASWCGAGGPAANAAATVALLGGAATIVAPVGTDRPGQLVRADLDAAGVQLVVPESLVAQPTTVSSVWVAADTGERTVLSTNAAAAGEATAGVALPADTAVVLVDGFLPALACAAAAAARERHLPVVLDGGSYKPVHDDLLDLVDHAICSARFAFPDALGDGAAQHLRRLAAIVGEFAAITDGANPIVYRRAPSAAGTDPGDPVGEVMPPRPPRVVDTCGAGDVFHGAYAHHLSDRGGDPVAALTAAAEVAAASVAHPGPRAWAGESGNADTSRTP